MDKPVFRGDGCDSEYDADEDRMTVHTWGQCPSGMGGVAGVVHSPEN